MDHHVPHLFNPSHRLLSAFLARLPILILVIGVVSFGGCFDDIKQCEEGSATRPCSGDATGSPGEGSGSGGGTGGGDGGG